jgi:hypothetical protein
VRWRKEEDGEQERARGEETAQGRKHDVVTDDWVKDGGRRLIMGSRGPGSVSACFNEERFTRMALKKNGSFFIFELEINFY